VGQGAMPEGALHGACGCTRVSLRSTQATRWTCKKPPSRTKGYPLVESLNGLKFDWMWKKSTEEKEIGIIVANGITDTKTFIEI
jgi:hypothetical protein